MKTILSTIIICVAVASGIKYIKNYYNTAITHNHQIEVAMASIER